tara:strand:+ start:1455 stop:1781 length:327 start_codon:yes stop_codon:yes gene_type:complete
MSIGIGDLIRLKDDKHMLVGIGIVLDRREDTYDLAVEVLESFNEYMTAVEGDRFTPETLSEAEAELLKTPVYLVLWHSADDHTFSSKPIWMYDSEIEVVNAAVRKDNN